MQIQNCLYIFEPNCGSFYEFLKIFYASSTHNLTVHDDNKHFKSFKEMLLIQIFVTILT